MSSCVTETWYNLPGNLLVWYLAWIDKGYYFAVWHCWKERKRVQIRGRSLHFNPTNGIMKIMGFEIQALRVKQVVAVLLHNSRMHDYVIGLPGDATLETSLTLLSQFIKEDVHKTKFCKEWGFKYKATTGHSEESCFWGKNKSELFQTFSAFDLFFSGSSLVSNQLHCMEVDNGVKSCDWWWS